MADKKEEKLLDDIEKRTKELQERIDLVDKPLRLLPAWMNLHAHSINRLFAVSQQFYSFLESGQFDEVYAHNAVQVILQILRALEKELKENKRLLWKDIRAAKRADKMLIRIERDDIAVSGEEKGRMRGDILGELKRMKGAERLFNQILGDIRFYTWKIREIWNDVNDEIKMLEGYLKDKNIKKLKEENRIKKIEKEIEYIRKVIVPSESKVHLNMIYIVNMLHTLHSHVAALKAGAKHVIVPAA